LQLQALFRHSSLQTCPGFSFWTSFPVSFSDPSLQTFGLSFLIFDVSFPIFGLSSLQDQPRQIVASSPLVKHLVAEGVLTQEQLQSLWNG